MKKQFLLLALLIAVFSSPLTGQLGVNVQYHKSDYKDWNDILQDELSDGIDLYRHSYTLGLDYGFGLRQYRVDFYPEIFYKRGVTDYNDYGFEQAVSYQFDLKQIGFQLKTQVYPIDLLSKQGMQCPSFHRGGDVFNKGWFISFQPGLIYSIKELDGYRYYLDPEEINKREEKIIFGFGIGTGLDIGLSESFSLSPSINYHFILGEKWIGFTEVFKQPSYNAGTGLSYISFGIRIGIWF